MSLLDDVSIVVTPNGYKAGELYAVVPSSGAADMDVTRATDATRVNEAALIDDVLANVPRIDYTGGGCPHILAEPQRTNKLTYSEDFSQWNKSTSITVEINNAISPSGDVNASLVTTASSNRFIYLSASSPANSTFSIYAKWKNGSGGIDLSTDGGSNYTSVSVTNDWLRVSVTPSTSAFQCVLRVPTGGSELYLWGAQLEAGYATSYIPTSGSTVTRNQDQFTRDGIGSLIGQTEGTFFIELSKPVLNFSTQSLISLNNAASNSDANSIAIGFDTGDDFFIRLQSNNVLVFQETETNADANTFYKVAISYKSGESLMYLNGSPLTPTSGNLSNAFTFAVILDNLSFDFRGDGALPFFGKVKQLQVYKTALTDAQLTSLTS